jgi:dsRNA-specific ribonuclease
MGRSFGLATTFQFIRENYLAESINAFPLYVEHAVHDCEPDPNDEEMKKELLISHAEKLSELEDILEYQFQDRTLLLQALVHCSYNSSIVRIQVTDEREGYIRKLQKMRKSSLAFFGDHAQVGDFNRFNSEKLRFLGIAIYKYYATDYFIRHYSDSDPGPLTLSVHAVLDHNDVCIRSGVAKMDLGRFILHKYEEERAFVAQLDCYLSVIDAVFVDYYCLHLDNSWISHRSSDVTTPDKIIERFLYEPLQDATQIHPNHMKTPLKILVQHLCHLVYGQGSPKYDITENTEEASFTCVVTHSDHVLATVSAKFRKQSEREACSAAISSLQEKLKEKSTLVAN